MTSAYLVYNLDEMCKSRVLRTAIRVQHHDPGFPARRWTVIV